jgi:hypothetical protein
MTFSQVGVFTYGVLYVLLAYAMEVENLRLGYPGIYMAVSSQVAPARSQFLGVRVS